MVVCSEIGILCKAQVSFFCRGTRDGCGVAKAHDESPEKTGALKPKPFFLNPDSANQLGNPSPKL